VSAKSDGLVRGEPAANVIGAARRRARPPK
jgi:hypothetical protein